MAQHDYNVADAPGSTVRADLNDLFEAIATNNAGSTAPSTTFAHQWWFDEANELLKQRNAANDAWVTVAKKDSNGWTPYYRGSAIDAQFVPSGSKNATAYGAAGDGTTDDTSAIQAALDDVSSSKRTVVLPRGDYLVTGLTISVDRTVLVFQEGAKLVLDDDSDAPVVTVSADGVVLRGEHPVSPVEAATDLDPVVHIDGNGANQASGTSPGILADGVDGLLVVDLAIVDTEDRGVHVKNASRSGVLRSLVRDSGLVGIQGVAESGGQSLVDFSVVDCFVDRQDASADQGCIEATAQVGGTVVRPRVSGNTCLQSPEAVGSSVVAIELFGDPNDTDSLREGRVYGNHVRGGEIAISIANASRTIVVANTVFGAGTGIEAVSCTDVTVQGNLVVAAITTGIVVNGNAGVTTEHVSVCGNVVRETGSDATSGQRQNIYVLGSDTKHVSVVGNVVFGPGSQASGVHGIRVASGPEDVVISGNVLDGAGSGTNGITVTNAGNVTIVGNSIKGWIIRAVRIVANNAAISDFAIVSNDLDGPGAGVDYLEQSGGTISNVFAWPNLGGREPTQSSQPPLSSQDAGFPLFNTSTGLPEWWDGSGWIDAEGNTV